MLLVLVKAPQALPEQAAPETAQVTPWFWLSFDTFAVNANVCPWSSVDWAEGERETPTAATVMLNVCRAVSGVGETESVATTVKLEAAATVGTPEIAPALLKLSPGGKEEPDATVQVTGGVPPELAKVAL